MTFETWRWIAITYVVSVTTDIEFETVFKTVSVNAALVALNFMLLYQIWKDKGA